MIHINTKPEDIHHVNGIPEHTLQLAEYKFCQTINLDSYYKLHEMPQDILIQAVIDVVQVESPIHIDDVITRIRSLAGYDKTGSRIKHSITKAVDKAAKSTIRKTQDGFLWVKNQNTVIPRHRSFTIDIDKICNEEIKAIIHFVLNHQLGTERHDLCHQVSKLLGIQRRTTKTDDRVSAIIGNMIDSEEFFVNDNSYIEQKKRNS